MELKKKLKNFFTMTHKTNNGFTLVELIVVIAVIGILGGVAIPAYSGYVTKANKQADISLASEVAHALSLYYYSHPGEDGGYVTLTTSGAEASDEDMEAAMVAAFGESWRETCKLKYDGWTDGGLMDVVAGYTQEEAAQIADSTFMKNPEAMMDAATGLLNIAADRIFGSTNATQHIADLGGELGATLNSLNLELGSEEYSTAVANLLVGHFAEAMSPGSTTEGDTANITNLATFYAQVYAYGDPTLLESLNGMLKTASYDDLSDTTNVTKYKKALKQSNEEKFAGFSGYMKEEADGDSDAFKNMMKAVSVVADGYTDKDSLTNENLYSSPEVLEQVNNFANAVRAKAEGRFPDCISAGAVLVTLYDNGDTDSTIE